MAKNAMQIFLLWTVIGKDKVFLLENGYTKVSQLIVSE